MQALYMTDSYLRKFSAVAEEVNDKIVILDRTAFYPAGGGLPNDTGKIISGGNEFPVANVTKEGGRIFHHLESSADGILKPGDDIVGMIDWERRYRIMRMHTAAHIIDAILYNEAGALATGNQLGTEKSRIDFSLEVIDTEQIKRFIEKANDVVKQDIEVKIYFLKRDEAMKIPGIVKLAKAAPPNVEELRIVEIPGVDIQADGGTQVKRTSEIGEIVLSGMENKGKSYRRIYYTVR